MISSGLGSGAERGLHVLTITPFYPRAGDESAGCFVAEPLAELVKSGIRATVLAVEPAYRPRSAPVPSAVPAEWVRYPAPPGNLGLASAGTGLYWRLRGAVSRLHKATPIDVIHAHAALPCGDAARRLSQDFKIPYVVTVHGLDAFSTMQVRGLPGAWCARVSREVFESARRVIGVSRHVCDQVRKEAKADAAVVYNGVDTNLFQPGDDQNAAVLLSVGNMIPTKGHALVVEALAALSPEFPELRWDVIGDGPELEPVRNLAQQLGVLSAIDFRGRQSRRVVAEACRRCTIFVLPSRYEGLGCVYLEAMASGKVAVGCTGQGIEEIIQHGENGWLVPPNGKAELIDGLRQLLRDDALRRRIGEAARNMVLQSLTVQDQARRLLEIYRESAA